MIKPILDNVVVKKKEHETKTSSGIILNNIDDSEFLREVIAVGPQVPDDVKPGDMVRVVSQTYKETYEGFEIIKYEQILGIVVV